MIKERMPVSKAPERKPERKREPAVAESGQNQPRKEPANIGELHALQASLENLLNWSISKKASQAEINERKKALERVDEEIQTLEDEIVNIENPGLRDKRKKNEEISLTEIPLNRIHHFFAEVKQKNFYLCFRLISSTMISY